MKSLVLPAAVAAVLCAAVVAPALSLEQAQTQQSQSSSSTASSASSSSSSPDCPAKPAAGPVKPKRDPTGRTTSSCFDPYVKQPGTASSSSTSSAPR